LGTWRGQLRRCGPCRWGRWGTPPLSLSSCDANMAGLRRPFTFCAAQSRGMQPSVSVYQALICEFLAKEDLPGALFMQQRPRASPSSRRQ
jgi:hypothetical protein